MPNRKKYYAIFEDFVKGDIVLDKTETYEQAEQVIENHKTKSRMLIGLNPLGSLSYSNKYRIDEIDWEKLNKIDKKADEEWYEDVGYGDPRVDNEGGNHSEKIQGGKTYSHAPYTVKCRSCN